MTLLIILAVLALLYLLSLRCRKHPGMEALTKFVYAHRGLHREGVPENSMAAFRYAFDCGYGVELDIHLMRDGGLAVIHDSLLNRTTGQAGHIEDLTSRDLPDYPLEGTEERIPLLRDVLDLCAGRTPIIVELKVHDNNVEPLCKAACDMLSGYDGLYCLESFDPRCLRWLKKHRPELIRGQLTENYLKGRSDLPDVLKFILTHSLENFLTVPDFIAYQYRHRNDSLSTWLSRKLWGAQGVAWTIRRKEDLETAQKEGWIPIFEGFEV